MSSKQIESVYPLTPMQQGMLFHTLYAPESDLYITQLICTLEGALDGAAFERAWQRTVERHAALRTAFAWEGLDEPLQVVGRQARLPLEQHDWRAIPPMEQAERLEQLIVADRRRGFKLNRAPLMRLTLVRTADEIYQLIWNQHHLLLDGWCAALVIREVFDFYRAFSAGQELTLEQPRPYQEYIAWLQRQDLARAEAFWREELRGFSMPTPLLSDAGMPLAKPAGAYDERQVGLDAEATQALRALAQQNQITLNTIMRGAWAVLLRHYSGHDDVLFGATVAGRPPELPGVESMVGLFINTLPVRVAIDPQQPLVAWLRGMQERQSALQQYEHSPLAQVQRWGELAPGAPLFESVLVFENYPADAALRRWDGSPRVSAVRSFSGRTNYPLTLFAVPDQELILRLVYDCGRIADDTAAQILDQLCALLKEIAARPEAPVGDLTFAQREQVAISATFTAEPVEEALAFWLRQLDLPAQIAFAPYNQTFQQLLDPHSLLGANQRGANVLLLRFEDWLRYAEGEHSLEQQAARVEQTLEEFIQAVEGMASRRATPLLIAVCPDSPEVREQHGALFDQLERRLRDALGGLASVTLIGGADYAAYPVAEIFDPHGDALGHIPFTRAFFTALGTLIARRIHALRFEAVKVIVLDCDQTLWDGVVGEDEAQGVAIGAERRALQALIVEQQRAGRLICLCSKNNEQDVFEVFEQREEMLLKREHLVAWRVNWRSKADNLAELAQELQLGLDSFMFIDDDALECAQMRERRPEVLTIQLPRTDQAAFLRHVWPFDHLRVTEEDRRRSELYGQNAQRERERRQSRSLGEFLEGLGLKVRIDALQPAQVARVAQLTQRTNQFNLGEIRRSESEIQQLAADCLTVEVSDRFGDYGLVGALVTRAAAGTLFVDTFLLSCRALGRGVEHHMLRHLGELALARGMENVTLRFVETSKNMPARAFLASLATAERLPGDRAELVVIPAIAAAALTYAPDAEAAPVHDATPAPRAATGSRRRVANRLARVTTALREIPVLLATLDHQRRHERPNLATAYEAPRTALEATLASLWQELLGIERVGIHDHFFALGGHSLLAARVLARLRDQLNRELPLRLLFDHPTIAALAAALAALPALAAPPPALLPSTSPGPHPLAFAQQRLWFLSQLAPDQPLYTIAGALALDGMLDPDALDASLTALVQRHAVLRTCFPIDQGQPHQQVAPAAEAAALVPLLRLDLDAADAPAWLEAFIRQPFDLEHGPLVRAALLRTAPQQHILALTLHHTIADGWSLGILVRELAALYQAERREQPVTLPTLPIQYADYALWQREWLQGAVLEQQLAFWRARLGQQPAPLALPTDHPRPALASYRGTSLPLAWDAAFSARLLALGQASGATLHMVLLAGFATLLSRLSGQERVLIGTPVAGRNHPELEGLIGCFINTLVLRGELADNPTVRVLLARMREECLEAYAHQDLPFEQLVEAVQPVRDLSRSPIFQVLFALQNAPMPSLELDELRVYPVESESRTSKFDLTLNLEETSGGIRGLLEYSTDLFDETTIARMIEQLTMLLDAMAENPDQRVADLPLLSAAEQRQILVDWNATAAELPGELCLHQLFEAQAVATPNAIAARDEAGQLSYAELNERANAVARQLRRLGVGPEVCVGICVERSLDMLVGLLGILKAGGAYVPLDPSYPAERLRYILADAQVPVLLTGREIRDWRLEIERDGQSPISNLQSPTVVYLDTDWEQIAQQPIANLESGVSPENLAYVIYTSGSTGTPKGVQVQHRSAVNFLRSMRRRPGIAADDILLAVTTLSFDIAGLELFLPLSVGAQVVIAGREVAVDGLRLQQQIERLGVTLMQAPPSTWRLMLSAGWAGAPQLRMLCGGEALPPDLADALLERGRELWNMYGPTETTIWSTICRVERGRRPLTIGRPIANTTVYILDPQLRPQPIGVVGELFIGGAGLARGYLGRPELTAERFVPNPFTQGRLEIRDWRLSASTISNLQSPISNRLYKTGDLARWLPNGTIEYLGRADFQVKIRGHRIELGEIEVALRALPETREAVALAREDTPGDQRLVAYVVPRAGQELTISALRLALRERLPDYMIPTALVLLDTLPRMPNGKLDRAALPVPDARRPELATAYVAPRTPTEEELAAIWRELLRLEQVGIEDNFFDVGGHSLIAMQLIWQVQSHFGVDVPLREYFLRPTIKDLAGLIEQHILDQSDASQFEALLDMLEQMSEDEAHDWYQTQP